MNSKRKGNRGELELLHILESNGITAQRNDQMYVGGSDNPDIIAYIGELPFHVEVKRVERLNLGAAMDQAIRDAGEGKTPCVVHRTNRRPWLVTLRLDDITSILKR